MTPNGAQFGFWQGLHHLHHSPARRRYKYEAKLGKGQHGGKLYRARCERGELWAIEVFTDHAKAAAALRKLQQQLSEEAKALCMAGQEHQERLGAEEMYTDTKTGAKCLVSKLPKETMRQRIMSDASYGLELVLKWAKQLASGVGATSTAASSKQDANVTLDNVFLDEADCVLVGNFLPSDSHMHTPSAGSSEDDSEDSDGQEADTQEEEEEEEDEEDDFADDGMDEGRSYAHPQHCEEEEEEEEELDTKQPAALRQSVGDASTVSVKMEAPDEDGAGERLSSVSQGTISSSSSSSSGYGLLLRRKPSSSVPPKSKSGTALLAEAAAVLSREEELKRWGVLMYQVATKTILHGDVDTARRQILRSAEADAAPGSTRKEALLALLHKQLGIKPSSNSSTSTSSNKPAKASSSLRSLTNVIVDAVLGEASTGDLVARISSGETGEVGEDMVFASLPPPRPKQSLPPLPLPPQQPQQQQQEQAPALVVPHPISTMLRASSSCSSLASFSSSSSVSSLASSPRIAHPARATSPSLPTTMAAGSSTPPTPSLHATRSILAALQQTRDTKMRQRALVALGKLGCKAAVPEVVQALVLIMEKDADPVSRRLGAWTLGSMGAGAPTKLATAVTPLIRALGDEESSVRAAAAWALGNLGRVCEERGAVATLMHKSVKDVDAQVREMAVKALARVGKVTGKRRRDTSNEAASPLTSGGRPNAYAKRRPVCLASATLSMEMTSISGGMMVAMPVGVSQIYAQDEEEKAEQQN